MNKEFKYRWSSIGFLFPVILFLWFVNVASGIERDKILYFTDVDGLPRNIITCIEQDKYGYTWVGTGNGIARYDGNNFVTYNQLKGVNIHNILIDTKNNLWIVADQGLYKYNRLADFFDIKLEGYIRSIRQDKDEIYILNQDRIQKLSTPENIEIKQEPDFRDFFIDEAGIWFSNSYDGVKLLSRESGFREITEHFIDGKYVSVIRKIDGNLFWGCRNGELFVKKANGKEQRIDIENHHSLQEIVKIDDEIWLATDGNGIIILDSDLNFSRALNRTSNRNSKLSSNSIYDIYNGENNEIWMATYGGGLICLLADDLPFKNIIPEPGNRNSLVANEGATVFSGNNKIYLGTNYGMSILDEKTGIFTNFPMNRMKRDLKGSKVLAINTDAQNNLWIGTYDGLLGKYSSDYKLISQYNPCSDNFNEMQRIIFIKNYNSSNLIIGTHYREKNLLNFDLKTNTFSPFSVFYNGIKRTNFQVISIRKNQKGESLVLIRNFGLFSINLENNILENNFPEINKRVTFRLNDFYQDKKGFYWFTTEKDGLIRMSENGLEFDKWTIKEGFLTNTLLRIESTDDKFLWISTISGLCRFEMATGHILNFKHRDGLSANEFSVRTSDKTNDGRLVFGSNAGFTIVNPGKIKADTSKTEVIISDITFQNQSIRSIDDEYYLSVPLEETKELKLPFRRNSFTIHFFSKDKNLPKYNNYAYRLLGLEDDWIYLAETKHTTYTNLSPGTYTFEVKSTNKSNDWSNPPTQLSIEISPPWYLSWYAYTGYIFLFLFTLFVSLYIYTNRVHLKKEVEMSEYKVQKEHELTENKLAFFTNISHDLKTPLTLIDAPVQDLLQSDSLNEDQKAKLTVISRNSKRLYKLISDLLHFRKLTQKQLPLIVSETKINDLVENIYESFKEECKNKLIEFERSITVKKPAFVDGKKIEKIMWNLLSNALKFTDEEGEIFLSAEDILLEGKTYLRLLVKDTGKGIEEQVQQKIFDRFYQVYKSENISLEGTGIGLSIVKDLVDLHHGKISVESTPGVGTTFIILIPAEKNNYSEKELAEKNTNLNLPEKNKEKTEVEFETTTTITHTQYNLPFILIVEDNRELREYLAGHFEKRYKVHQAEDGLVGLKTAKDKNIDIILTDIQMPNMNGYDFCKKIRQNFETSHIPVVMLTANSAVEQQIEGLSTGADAYVTKPFDINLLDTVLRSVLENRKKLRNKFLGIEQTEEEENKLPQKDFDFIASLKLYIEENIEKQNLNIELLAEHFSISRTQLNRKIKSLAGQTPNNLIKTIRLRKAYELIREKGVRVSEAAYKTGFSDPNYFTICFKKEFGENPSKISG